MELQLSIIMPCYNCQNTLREAVDSCYTQGFSDEEFEIIMVDDGSTDDTRSLLGELSDIYKNIHIFFHEKNKGGGAARNTAVSHANSEVIFCLDGDDVLPPNVLHKMVETLHKEKLDGVLFSETRFFNTNLNRTESIFNQPVDTIITLEDLFMKKSGFLTQVNFLYTKKAFNITGGYPTSHGFDTQAFGISFLANNLHVSVCPNTFYYHRQSQTGSKSYYQREYERGLISVNSYLSFEPIIENLYPDVIMLMIDFDIFKKNIHGVNTNLRAAMTSYAQSGKPIRNSTNIQSSSISSVYIKLCKYIQEEQYDEALLTLKKCIQKVGTETPLLQYMRLRISYGLQGYPPNKINEQVAIQLQNDGILNRPKYRIIPAVLKPLHKLYLYIFK